MKIKANLIPFTMAIFVMIYPLRGGDTLGLGFLPSAGALILVAMAFVYRPRSHVVLARADLAVFSYFFLLLVSVLVAGANNISIRYLLQIVALSIIPYTLVRIAGLSLDNARRFLGLFPFVTILSAASMFVIVGPTQIIAYSGYRLGTETLNPVGIGYSFGLGALLTLAALKLRLCGLIFGLLSLAVSVAIMVMTASRGPLLSLAVVSFVLLFARVRLNWRMGLAIGALSSGAYFAFGTLSQIMVADRFNNFSESSSVEARLSSWTNALSMFIERPFLGFGLGAFEKAHGEYVHNVILEHLANGGILMTFAFVSLVVTLLPLFLSGIRRGGNEVVAILAIAGGYAILARLFSLSMSNTKEVFLFLAMALSCAQGLGRRQVTPR